jgi:flavin-dependent dehydrogenase
MDRRDFIKVLTAGGAMLAFDPFLIAKRYGEAPMSPLSGRAIFQAPYQQPVWKDVDVVVIGSTTGAVAAAMAAADAGAKVFVASPLSYMGEDVCGSFRYWPSVRDSESSLFRKVFPGGVAPYPLHVKSTLENELIFRKVDFVYCSYVSNILVDDKGRLAGVCIANRSGQQVIRAKAVIDTTHHATVARMAGIPFHPFVPGEHKFRFAVVGNQEHSDPSISKARRIYPAFNVKNKSHHVWEYEFNMPLKDDSYASLMKVEQKIRTLVWDVDQTDSADIPYYIPSSYVKAKDPFRTDKYSNLFVLGPSSAIARAEAEQWMEPARYMESGEKVGRKAAESAAAFGAHGDITIAPLVDTGDKYGEISIHSPFRFFAPLAVAGYKGGGIPVIGEYDVVVAGGGTAGAPAAISAARKGVKTLLLESLHGLGGISTFGFIGRYTAGYRKGFTAEVDVAMQTIAPADHPRHIKKDSSDWPLDWKAEWYRAEALKAGADIWFQTIAGGVIKNGNKIEGIVVYTPYGQGIIRCKRLIDSTGSADLAIAAGAAFEYTGKESLAVQGAGLGKYDPGDHYNNTDWTFVDDSDVLDVTRLFIQCKVKNQGNYDIGKLPQTRERRRVKAEYNVSVFDMINQRTYSDTISYHISSFDTHGFTEDVYFTVRPPERKAWYDVNLPLRSLLPQGLDNILVTGLGCGSHRDAMPVIRMQPDLQNQGYAAGLAAADSVMQKVPFRELDMRSVQKQLVEKGNLPEEVLTYGDDYAMDKKEMEKVLALIPNGYEGLEKVLAFPEVSVPLMKKWYNRVPASEKHYYGNILCMLKESVGWQSVLAQVKTFGEWDKGWNYRGMHQFGFSVSRLDNYVMALGYTGRKEVIPELLRLADMLTPQSEFSHVRAMAIAAENLKSPELAASLARLLKMEGMTGYHIADHLEALDKLTLNIIDKVYILEDTLRNSALKELYIAKALYICSDADGLGEKTLKNYASGLEGHYARFAYEVLNS